MPIPSLRRIRESTYGLAAYSPRIRVSCPKKVRQQQISTSPIFPNIQQESRQSEERIESHIK